LAALSLITPSERTQVYSLLGLPLYVKYDSTDNLLNPTRGLRAQVATTPAQSLSGPNLTFVTNWASLSAYRPLDRGDRVVLALRAAAASIEGGPSLLMLPADKRLYAGGGGSIRAYGYEMAGLLDTNNIPIGGKSSLVFNLELRTRITENFGIVPFLDAGSYYEKAVPQLGERLFYGPGLGFRYFTPFGPLRLDIATPFNKRPADAPVQFYISIGQAF
jgi:translocation and assembly module TamA